MRIGILTFHKPINYGAFLQAFSLSGQLQKRFPDCKVEIIDYIAPKESRKRFLNILRDIKHHGLKAGMQSAGRYLVFRKSQKHLKLSRESFCTEKQTALFSFIDDNYDYLIIGSDAVFNWQQNGYPSAFIPGYDFKRCKVLCYAASVHGLRYLEEPEEYIHNCGKSFKKMLFVGTRDRNTENFVRYCTEHAKIMHCCDPTVIIDVAKIQEKADGYRARILKKYKCDLSKKYIVLMIPDSSATKAVREKYSEEFQIITLFKPSKDANFYLYDLNPFEWAAVLSGASVVITSYFHGTLLALKQNVPVISVDYSNYNDDVYEGKLQDLMCTRLKLAELYFDGRNISCKEVSNLLINNIDKALAGNYRQRIEEAMKQESACFDEFCISLKAELEA